MVRIIFLFCLAMAAIGEKRVTDTSDQTSSNPLIWMMLKQIDRLESRQGALQTLSNDNRIMINKMEMNLNSKEETSKKMKELEEKLQNVISEMSKDREQTSKLAAMIDKMQKEKLVRKTQIEMVTSRIDSLSSQCATCSTYEKWVDDVVSQFNRSQVEFIKFQTVVKTNIQYEASKQNEFEEKLHNATGEISKDREQASKLAAMIDKTQREILESKTQMETVTSRIESLNSQCATCSSCQKKIDEVVAQCNRSQLEFAEFQKVVNNRMDSIVKDPLSGCIKGWKLYGSHCYYYAVDLKSWQDAVDACKKMNSSLVKIENSEENNWLKSNLKEDTWIGGNDLQTEGQWRWVSDVTAVTFTDWSPGEPTNGDGVEHCASFWKDRLFRWNDQLCSNQKEYICEMLLDNGHKR